VERGDKNDLPFIAGIKYNITTPLVNSVTIVELVTHFKAFNNENWGVKVEKYTFLCRMTAINFYVSLTLRMTTTSVIIKFQKYTLLYSIL
jgi:hypothetical protein